MAMETMSAAEGNIEVMFLKQMGRDPSIPTPERTTQIREVASRVARFINRYHSQNSIQWVRNHCMTTLVSRLCEGLRGGPGRIRTSMQ